MNKAEVLRQITGTGIIPVVRAQSADEAMRAVEAIKAGGISVLELTMTVPGAVKLIDDYSRRYQSDGIVRPGTVLDAGPARVCSSAQAPRLLRPTPDSG